MEHCTAPTSLINVAIIGPTSGIVNKFRYAVYYEDNAAISLSKQVTRSLKPAYLIAMKKAIGEA